MDPTGLLLLVAAGVAFYFLIIRPQRQRQRQQASLIANMKPGTEVMTTAGMFGTVAAVTDDQVSLEISPGVFVRVVPQAIGKVIEPVSDESDAAPDIDAAPGESGTDPKPPVD